MKTIIVVFVASVMIIATFEAHAAEAAHVKTRYLLSYPAANQGLEPAKNIGTNNINGDDGDSTTEQSTHHYLPDQDPKNGPQPRSP
ncbi:hypothetical protein C2S52_014370 [Perilla frutescens var. hirtella]|nr:hypothetical protein C2S52_014370 [Perilla frutescens var. hirtella]